MTEIEIHGCIYVEDRALSTDEVSKKFIEFVETNGWMFGGGFRTVVDGEYISE